MSHPNANNGGPSNSIDRGARRHGMRMDEGQDYHDNYMGGG